MNIKSSKILIGVTGGIAAYKTCSLVTSLLREGADIEIVMTDAAKKFVTPLTFQSILNKPVYSDIWESDNETNIKHIKLAQWPDLVVIAPATANTISKISLGLADNLLSTIALALLPSTPVIIAPAMNTNMWINPSFVENLERLKRYKRYIIMEPRSGVLACRDEGVGKIPSTEEIIETIKKIND
jgi:phosphopantothenoylcysteine decarboxylase/phosphopantothenate--cysteine ligase